MGSTKPGTQCAPGSGVGSVVGHYSTGTSCSSRPSHHVWRLATPCAPVTTRHTNGAEAAINRLECSTFSRSVVRLSSESDIICSFA